MKKQNGITLVALVITIIVLLILAGVTIAALSGPNGILSNAVKANEETAKSQAREAVCIAVSEVLTNYYVEDTTGGTPVDLSYDNVIESIERNYPDFDSVTEGTNKITIEINGITVEVPVTISSGTPSTWTVGQPTIVD